MAIVTGPIGNAGGRYAAPVRRAVVPTPVVRATPGRKAFTRSTNQRVYRR